MISVANARSFAYNHVMSPRRSRGRPRASPVYNPSLPQNWTVARLRTECERFNINVPRHSRKAELVSAYINASDNQHQLQNALDASSPIRRRGFLSAAVAITSTSRERKPGAAVDQSGDAHNGETPNNQNGSAQEAAVVLGTVMDAMSVLTRKVEAPQQQLDTRSQPNNDSPSQHGHNDIPPQLPYQGKFPLSQTPAVNLFSNHF